MSENLHNIDKLFKNAIEDHAELPSADVWSNIDKGLDKNKVVSIQRKYYVLKRVAFGVFIFGFVASVFAVYYNGRYKNTPLVTANRAGNRETTVKTKEKTSEGTQNTNIDKRNEGKESQASTKLNGTTNTNDVNIASSNSSSNSSDAALSSANYNKINNQPSTSSPVIVAAVSEKREIAYKNKIATASNKLTDNDPSGKLSQRLIEGISADRLVNLFQPAFTKSFDRSDIAPASATPISKLKKLPHVAITVFAGPQKNITHLKDGDDQQALRRGSRDEFRHSEQSMSSVRTGLLFEYPFTSNWSIASGIVYSSSVTSIAPKIVFARQDDRGNIKYEFNCSAGYAYIPAKSGSTPLIGDSAKVYNSKTHISFISIPVSAGYNLSAGKFILKPSAGLLLNILTTGNVQSEISSNSMNHVNSTNSISGLKSNYISGEVNFTAVYQLNNKIGVMIAPGTQFALTSINKNTSVKTYPGYVGVTGGVRVAF
jgi:hypothetical protein